MSDVVTLPDVERGFVLPPGQWAVERHVGRMSRFRHLAREGERLASVPKGVHLVAVTTLVWKQVRPLRGLRSPSQP